MNGDDNNEESGEGHTQEKGKEKTTKNEKGKLNNNNIEEKQEIKKGTHDTIHFVLH